MSPPANLSTILKQLMALTAETEWVEFKEAKRSYETDDLGAYFSALSNEANLKGQSAGWLVFGITDKPPRTIVGSQYRSHRAKLESLKHEVAQQTNNGLTFIEIHELEVSQRRVVMFEIPPASRGVPTAWKGHFYGRNGESLGPLNLQEIERIRGQGVRDDWSAHECEEAELDDLDPRAVAFARKMYKQKHPVLAGEVDQWDDAVFLNKAKLCAGGRILRTALILLGKSEAEHHLASGVARISWVLKDGNGVEQDYQHFTPPMILAVDQIFAKVRNLTYRYLPDASLFPTEVTQYDPWVIRETLHNCIAHQDYSLGGRVNVVEEPDALTFTNLGEFLPGSVAEVIQRDAPPELYRNRSLADAMVNLNMIDTIGSGIKRMFRKQRERFFPLPDFDLSEPGRVKVRINGAVIDERYTRLLIVRTDLDLMTVVALDNVQKGRQITDAEFASLKSKHLIEGRRPNLFVSAKVAAATDTRADYIKNRAFDKEHYKRLVVAFLDKFGEARRADMDKLLLSKLSDALTDEQKRNVVMNLLQEMRGEGTIRRAGRRGRGAKWVLHRSPTKDGN